MMSNALRPEPERTVPARARNLAALHRELDWLGEVIDGVIGRYLQHEDHAHRVDPDPPSLEPVDSVHARQALAWGLGRAERLALALALAPHLRPAMLDIFFGVNALTERGFSEFGGHRDRAFSGFLPTGQTLAFLLNGDDGAGLLDARHVLSPQHRFAAEQVLALERVDDKVPHLAGVLSLSEQWLHFLLTGESVRPELRSDFPASPITTPLAWSDLVLEHGVMAQVRDILAWLNHGKALMHDWGLARKVKPGYRTVFYGPPGTGKTLTAALLGKSTGREVYRVDLSMIVSKYIGETEKNLGRVFDAASYKDWILFFDEADALFGKRTAASTSNDRHANQQTGYLLQRIEDFPGTVILATNLKANMDEAFTRRFQSLIHFTMPAAAQRQQLWKNAFDGVCELGPDVDLRKLAQDHELAGGAIVNVLRYCALDAINRGTRVVGHAALMKGIRDEYRKDNKTMPANLG
jgi:DNA polymerase III delta prime subunit